MRSPDYLITLPRILSLPWLIFVRYTLVATLPSEQRGVSSAESYKTEMSFEVVDGKPVDDVRLTPVLVSTLQASQVCVCPSCSGP